MQTCQKSHEACQALTPVIEKAHERWILQMGAQGFPWRLGIFKAMAEKLYKREAMVLVLLGFKGFSTGVMHYQYALHQL